MPGNGSGVNILMFWYDMDVGISPNTDGTERLTIRDETGAVVRMRPRRSSADGSSSWNSTGNFLTALTGANLNGGFSGASGGSKYGVAEFNVKRDSTYTVTFANMEYSSNALEVYLPFADYNGTWQCPQPLHNIERAIGSCNVIGYYYYPLNRSEKYTVNLQFRLGTSGAWSSTLTDLANRTGSQYGAGSGNGFTRAPPANLLSATQNLYVRAWVIYNGVQDTLTNLTTGLNLGICGTWDLRPAITGNPPPSAVFPKPGSSLTISTVVRNWGDSASSNYTLERRVVSGGGILTNASTISSSHGALAAGASISAVTRNYTIRPDAADGSTVCFESRVSPMTNTNSGWRNSNRICYTIYNERFDLNLVITMPTQAFPGQNIDISYSVCNQSDDELNLIAPAPGTASRGDSPPTTITTSGALNPGLTNNTNQTITNGNCWDNFNRTVQIPASAVVGDTLCTTLTSNRNHGFSDGTGLGGHPVSLQECLVIADGPYLQVLGHDTWAGGAFARNGSCNVTGSGNITSLTTANLTSSGTVGALDQYAAFARGDLSGFGTAGNAGGSSLTFANTGTPLGRFGANNRCLYDLFDNGGAGGSIDDALWNNAADESNLNSIGQNQEGQLRISGATTYSSSGSPFNNFRGNATILINGNFDIRRDIILNNSLSMGDVPFLVFVVAGDIRIQNDVNRLDGIYIALGQVDTCSTFGSGSLSPFTDLTANPPCNQHLRINGSLIANDIALRRTHGGTNEASTGNNLNRCLPGSTPAPLNSRDRRCAAETIIFPPWFYLADPFFDRGSSSLIEDYRIQQIRDLPPIF
ncbi:MAG TPA: hypothetical protein VF996_01040 [Candidatus Saccharimonadales bacterium]